MTIASELEKLQSNITNAYTAIEESGGVLPDNLNMDNLSTAIYSTNMRNIGQIIESALPLSDAGLHLLDGAVISGSGMYADFVDYIADLYGDGTNIPAYFTTEANWQTSVTNYGVCGKFVYDSTSNTVRLPKITGFIEGTTDTSALGDLIQAGLPNITGQFDRPNAYGVGPVSGVFANGDAVGGYARWVNGADSSYVTFDASRSSSIYGNSSTVQPQAIKVLYYIVIANITKTEIQVDIDEISADLANKVDINDMETVQVVVETYVNGTSWYRLYSDGWCEQGGYVSSIPSGLTGSSVVFLKEFANTDYFSVPAWGSADYAAVTSDNRLTTGMTIINRTNSAQWCYWYACGYIEE